jgi:hypothetical protein
MHNILAAEDENFGVSAADFDDERGSVFADGIFLEEGPDAEVCEAGDFSIVNEFDGETGGDIDAVKDFESVDGFAYGAGGNDADGFRIGALVFAEFSAVAFEDADAFLERFALDFTDGEGVFAEAHTADELFEDSDF